MELRRYLGILRQRVALIVASVVVALIVGWLNTSQTSIYSAKATIYLGPRAFTFQNGLQDIQSIQTTQGIIFTYARMITSPTIVAKAVAATGAARDVGTAQAETSASVEPGTQLLDVTVSDPNPAVAQILSNGIADAFVHELESLVPPAATGSVPQIPGFVFQTASLPSVPLSTGLTKSLVLAGLLGLAAAIGLAFVLEYLDITVKNPTDAEHQLEMPVLGIIPLVNRTPQDQRFIIRAKEWARFLPWVKATSGSPLPPASGPQAEAFRILLSNLEVSLLELAQPTVMVTSAVAGEGKTSAAINLASGLARNDRRVVLVDLDLRQGRLHQGFDLVNSEGVTEVLTGQADLDKCLQFVTVGRKSRGSTAGMYVLTAGAHAEDPTELLSGPEARIMLDGLAQAADIVVIDAPPVLPVADTLIIGRLVDAAVMVAASRSTPLSAIRRARNALARSHIRILGIIVNKVQASDARLDLGYGYGGGGTNGMAVETIGRREGGPLLGSTSGPSNA
ncbi:MAG: tyrosine-protein kinase domain-containing protein [Acidimicrobiales bacterium]